MASKYIPSGQRKHSALTNRDEIVRVFERYDWSPTAAARAMDCKDTTAINALKRLAPDVYKQKKADGKLSHAWGRWAL